MANAEMSTKGHFWEQRFGAREIADEAALLTCMVYVDVNQVKARMAPSLEQSRCSAVAARLAAAREREALASFEAFHKSRSKQCELSTEQLAALFADAWLAPIATDGPLMTAASLPQSDDAGSTPPGSTEDTVPASATDVPAEERGSSTTESGASSSSKSSTSTPPSSEVPLPETPLDAANRAIYRRLFGQGRRRRVSDSPILSMPFQDYRQIVEWVAEQTTGALAAPASIPEVLVQYLQTHGVDPDNWPLAVLHFQEWFGRAVGSDERMREVMERTGNCRIRGMRNCRATFG